MEAAGIDSGAKTRSTDVRVGDVPPPTESTKIENLSACPGLKPSSTQSSKAMQVEGHGIQQGNAGVSDGIQQDVGELAILTPPLYLQGNRGLELKTTDSTRSPVVLAVTIGVKAVTIRPSLIALEVVNAVTIESSWAENDYELVIIWIEAGWRMVKWRRRELILGAKTRSTDVRVGDVPPPDGIHQNRKSFGLSG
ncbi:hypothetical protein R3P38DRAFT_2804959 [Favolaschia claudopus]|uniref:Uncharacterized protein n=1 Tax=Favolaschia claudopus TaxID=2862362 RepID=A0AAV9ZPV4_9AGAR